MGTAQGAYIYDWNGFIPPHAHWYGDHNYTDWMVGNGIFTGWGRKSKDKKAVINAYLGPNVDANVFNTIDNLVCPAFEHMEELIDLNGTPKTTTGTVEADFSSYARNGYYTGVMWNWTSRAYFWVFRKIEDVKTPSSIISDADSGFAVSYTSVRELPYIPLIHRYSGFDDSRTPPLPEFLSELQFPIGNRHLDGANAVCLDGHVEWMTQGKWHHPDQENRWNDYALGSAIFPSYNPYPRP